MQPPNSPQDFPNYNNPPVNNPGGLGTLGGYPLALMSITLAYRDFFMSGGTPFQPPIYPNAPIADPNA